MIEAAKNGSRINAAFAMAEARVQLIESLTDENIKARLLRMTDPRINMVELANNPTDEDRIRVCAIAILSGFCPGDDQFAVFGGKGGGKLYTKEAGFRTLFAHLGIVPDVSVGHPEFVPLGKSGKKIWRVEGKASCSYGGKEYAVEFAGAMALGLPGYESDNVAGITAKARRQILKALWTKVSPILNDDHADEVDVMPQAETPKIESAAITQQPEKHITESDGYHNYEAGDPRAAHYATFNRLVNNILKDNADEQLAAKDFWHAIRQAESLVKLDEVRKEIGSSPLSEAARVQLRKWYSSCESRLRALTEGGAA